MSGARAAEWSNANQAARRTFLAEQDGGNDETTALASREFNNHYRVAYFKLPPGT